MPLDILETLTEALSIQGAIIPGTVLNSGATVTAATVGINMKNFVRAMAEINVGAISAGGSITVTLQSSATVSGSYANISGSTMTITTASQVSTMEIRADEMPIGQPFLKVLITSTTAFNVAVSAVLWGGAAPQRPAKQWDVASLVGQRTVSSI